jgi:hypothetical protein
MPDLTGHRISNDFMEFHYAISGQAGNDAHQVVLLHSYQ